MTDRQEARPALLALVIAACLLAGCDDAVESPRGKEGGAVPAPSAPVAKAPARVELVWPTPNKAYLNGGDVHGFVQPTESGEVLSGLFGSVRSGGRQFHEGIDLYPVDRDRKGEPVDPVFAAMAGVVRHISSREGASSYGRYVVIEHLEQSPPVYSLYAHLSRIEPSLRVGREVVPGETIATMGRSAGGYTIPKQRAHLHFEIGLRITDRFQEWYKTRGFGSPNEHGLWNGMNLMGLDPLAFFARSRAGGLRSLDEVFAETPRAVTLRIAEPGEPDFVRRYPSLVASSAEIGAGWEVSFSATGVPLGWRRLGVAEVAGWRRGEIRIDRVDTELLRANRGRKLVETRRGEARPGEDLRSVIEQLWGGRR
jgi:murein DD-endopeptidase MepM/ murein hydrolase activator NlpD